MPTRGTLLIFKHCSTRQENQNFDYCFAEIFLKSENSSPNVLKEKINEILFSSKNVQADIAVRKHVRVKNAGLKFHVRGTLWVLLRKTQVELENAALEWGIVRAENNRFPHKDVVVHRGRA